MICLGCKLIAGKGKVFDALRFYKRAIHMDPNIEFKFYQQQQQQQQQSSEFSGRSSKKEKHKSENAKANSASDNQEEIDILERFSREISFPICEPASSANTIRTEMHISSLPAEIFLHILKFVVSNDLDMRSLERFGSTCKGFFLLSRENEIWLKACKIVWKNNLSPPPQPPDLMTWRDIYIKRCRVLFDGCYISKITYQRLGENSFQDQFYRPVQIVEYFRLIRFFPNGELIMMTSADELQLSVNKLKNKKNAMQSKDILRGNYHYEDNNVLIVIKKTMDNGNNGGYSRFKRTKNIEPENCYTFFLELEISGTAKRKFTKLEWKNYSVSYMKKGEEFSSDYDLRSSTKYPPFFFSLVKSFHAKSFECLQ